ncbi:MAG: PKD domain-containing protein [Candidatus Thermoplasmatota archaeon]
MKTSIRVLVVSVGVLLVCGGLSVIGNSIQPSTAEPLSQTVELLANGNFSDGLNGWDQAITGYSGIGSPTGQSTSTAGGILGIGVENGYNQVHQNLQVSTTDLVFHGELRSLQFSSGGGMVSIMIIFYKDEPKEWSGNPPPDPSNAPGNNPYLGYILWYFRPDATYTSTNTEYYVKLGAGISDWYSVDANLHDLISAHLPGVNEADVNWVTVWAHLYAQDGGLTIGEYDNFSLTMEIPNQPPVADAGPDQTVHLDQQVTFDGSASYDPDGTIVSYEWDFDAAVDSDGDGNPTNDVDATGPTPTHVYTSEGVYTVTLKVTDDVGASATDTMTVTVLVPPPAELSIDKVKLSGIDQGYTHTYYEWELQINITNTGGSLASDVVVNDVLPAELELLVILPSCGSVETRITGEASGTRAALPPPTVYPVRSTHIEWTIGDLAAGQAETLYMKICTRQNPAGKQEFTSPGTYSLNDGAYVSGTDTSTGNEISAGPTAPITVIIEEQCQPLPVPSPAPVSTRQYARLFAWSRLSRII